MTIRKAELKDIEECKNIADIREFQMPNGNTPDLKYFKQSLNQIFLVAESNNQIIGLILGFNLTNEVVYLDLFTTHKDFRGKKAGTQLLIAFQNQLKIQGVKQYFLIAPSFNQRTLNFYRKNGLSEGKKQYTLFSQDL